MKIAIIKGVTDGMSAVTRPRRLMEDVGIIVMEKDPFVSLANHGSPYYVSGEITKGGQLLVQTPEALEVRSNLDIHLHHGVVAIDPIEKVITMKHEIEILAEHYDKLVLSPGVEPFVPPTIGLAGVRDVFSLRNVPGLDQIMTALVLETERAVVVGVDFIGLEMAENLQERGLEVTLVEKAPHALPPLDEEMAAFVKVELSRSSVQVVTGRSTVAFEEEGQVVRLEDDQALASDLTTLSVGVQPENTLAVEAGVTTGLRGDIVADEYYRTNQPGICMVGDAVVAK